MPRNPDLPKRPFVFTGDIHEDVAAMVRKHGLKLLVAALAKYTEEMGYRRLGAKLSVAYRDVFGFAYRDVFGHIPKDEEEK